MSKGSSRRPYDMSKFGENFDLAFKKKKKVKWEEEEVPGDELALYDKEPGVKVYLYDHSWHGNTGNVLVVQKPPRFLVPLLTASECAAAGGEKRFKKEMLSCVVNPVKCMVVRQGDKVGFAVIDGE